LVDFIDPLQVDLYIYSTVNVFVDFSYFDLQSGQFNANVLQGTNDDYSFSWFSEGIIVNNTIDPSIKGTLSASNINNPLFFANPAYICYPYVWSFLVIKKSNQCPVGGGRIVLPSPCDRIGKPINPDQAHRDRNIIDESVSIDNGIKIYPNPSKGSAFITLSGSRGFKNIDLVDMRGSVVQHWNNVITNTIQFKDLKTGIYILKVVTENGKMTTKKIIVNQ